MMSSCHDVILKLGAAELRDPTSESSACVVIRRSYTVDITGWPIHCSFAVRARRVPPRAIALVRMTIGFLTVCRSYEFSKLPSLIKPEEQALLRDGLCFLRERCHLGLAERRKVAGKLHVLFKLRDRVAADNDRAHRQRERIVHRFAHVQ